MSRKPLASDAIVKELRAYGLTFPGAHTKSPWPDHLDLAVKNKTFAFLSTEGEPFGISCKLPESAGAALTLPFAEPTPYGLGTSGWVSAQFPENQLPPIEMLKSWIDESYRAVAPKQLVTQLEKRAPKKTRASSARASESRASNGRTARSKPVAAKAKRKAAKPAKKRSR